MVLISVLLLCPNNSQDPRLLDCGDSIAHSPTSGSRICPLPHLRLPLRPPPPPPPLYYPRLPNHHCRSCDPTNRPPQFPHAVPRHMSDRHGLLLRRSHHHLLVPHESGRTHATEHRQRVDDWIRQHGWHRGDFLLPG